MCVFLVNSDLGGSFLKQHQQSLKDQVGETRTNGDVVQETLNVIHHYTAELGLVSIIKDLKKMRGGGGAKNDDRKALMHGKKQREESVVKGKEQTHIKSFYK